MFFIEKHIGVEGINQRMKHEKNFLMPSHSGALFQATAKA